MTVAQQKRHFALEVLRRLREAGHDAYWAGGCVRDELLGRTPKDYDVATSARPDQIRSLFGHRRTLAIGAAFGVITVLGPKPAGMIEVTTFREDADYSDGRHPDHVTYSSAREDALRRDFTVNGLFLDPVDGRVLDFVGGQEDLGRRVLRAIGLPQQRFDEDKLRMLRAVRFAASLVFQIDPDTVAAIRQMAPQIHVVSVERIAGEIRRMLVEPGRVRAVELMIEVGLAEVLLPTIVPRDPRGRELLDRALTVLGRLREPGFPLALVALLEAMIDVEAVRQLGYHWRLSNKEIEEIAWLVEHRHALIGAPAVRRSALQPLLLSPWIDDLVRLTEAARPEAAEDLAFVRGLLALPDEQFDPPPLVTGNDLRVLNLPAGPIYRELLQRIRDAQLDREVGSRDEALRFAEDVLAQRAEKSKT